MGTGTIVDPFTLDEALTSNSVNPGDTVYLRGGVYRQALGGLWQFPGGTSRAPVTWKAYEGERPVLSKETDIAPRIGIDDYVVLDGLWMGGRWPLWETSETGFITGSSNETGNHSISMGAHCEIKNCTLFGYHQGPQEGGGHHNTYSGNRFVRCGRGSKHHGIYIAVSGEEDKQALVENNIFVNGQAVALHFWHHASHCIVRNNFLGKHDIPFAANGDGHNFHHNILWRDDYGREAQIEWPTNFTAHHLFIYRASDYTNAVRDGNLFTDVYCLDCRNIETANARYGANVNIVEEGTEARYLGVTRQRIDDAIAALDTIFAGTVEEIAATADATIETHFATLKAVIDTWKANTE